MLCRLHIIYITPVSYVCMIYTYIYIYNIYTYIIKAVDKVCGRNVLGIRADQG